MSECECGGGTPEECLCFSKPGRIVGVMTMPEMVTLADYARERRARDEKWNTLGWQGSKL